MEGGVGFPFAKTQVVSSEEEINLREARYWEEVVRPPASPP